MLRKHQKEYKKTIADIIKGSPVKKIIISATPGAGKSSIPIITTDLIKYGLIHRLAWIVPRSALQDQGERGFLDPFFREMFDHNYNIRSSTNENNPCRGTHGFVTTYQALGTDKKNTVLKELKQWEYALILDEYHHLEEDKPWHEYIKILAKYAKYLILMTGTLGRNNGSKIAFTDYNNEGFPIIQSNETTSVIHYSRTDALNEKAILPIKFFFSDAKLEWINEAGTNVKINSFKSVKDKKDISDALYTALNSNFAIDLLNKCISHWIDYKKTNPSSKLLVVTDGKDNARKINKHLKSLNFNSEIATSHEPKKAIQAIKSFKNRLDIIVTIAMAYEGMDVPEISHIAALTNIRSKEWIEQMVARGVRINKKAGPYERQTCFVFAPSDKKFLSVAKKIESEQLTKLDIKLNIEPEEQSLFADEFEGIPLIKRGVTPIMGKMTGTNNFNIGQHNQIETISEKETKIRTEIKNHLSRCCHGSGNDIKYVNRDLKSVFGKPRSELNIKELEKLLIYVKKNYSHTVQGTQKGIKPYNPKNNREGIWSY